MYSEVLRRFSDVYWRIGGTHVLTSLRGELGGVRSNGLDGVDYLWIRSLFSSRVRGGTQSSGAGCCCVVRTTLHPVCMWTTAVGVPTTPAPLRCAHVVRTIISPS